MGKQGVLSCVYLQKFDAKNQAGKPAIENTYFVLGIKSVKGLGRVEPSRKENLPGSDGLCLPMGPAQGTKVAKMKGYTLNFNEFIVYDTRQIKMKFLAKIRFDFL